MALLWELLLAGGLSSFCSAAAYTIVQLAREHTARMRCRETARLDEERLKRGMDAYAEAIKKGREVDLVRTLEALAPTAVGQGAPPEPPTPTGELPGSGPPARRIRRTHARPLPRAPEHIAPGGE